MIRKLSFGDLCARPLVAAAVVVTGLMVWHALYHAGLPLHHDVGAMAYVGRLILEGKTLYRDLFEMNTPPAGYLMVPGALLAAAGLNPPDAFRAYVYLLVLLSVALCAKLSSELRSAPAARLAFLAGVAAALILLPGHLFGQREHFFVILVLPYVVAAGLRRASRGPTAAWSLPIGAAAALAFSIKPFFAAVALAVEWMLLWRRRQPGLLLRVESVVALAGTVAMALITIFVFPDYLGRMVPIARAFYGHYDQPMVIVIFGSWLAVALIATALGGLPRIAHAPAPVAAGLWEALLAAAIGAGVAYVMQGKGWAYHTLPMASFLLVQASLSLAWAVGWPRRALLAAVLVLAAVFAWLNWPRQDSTAGQRQLQQTIETRPGSFVIYSVTVWPGMSIAFETRRPWASRMGSLLAVASLVAPEPGPGLAAVEVFVRSTVAEDLRSFSPTTILVRSGGDQAVPPDFDLQGWLARDPAFREEWRHYRAAGEVIGYRIFVRD